MLGSMSFAMSITAFIPAIFLCGFIYYKDRIEKEPIRLLAFLFAAGAAAYYPTLCLQKPVSGLIDKVFSGFISRSPDGMARYSSQTAYVFHRLLIAFIGISLIEIAVKWAVLYLITHKNKNFNYLFDGVVYSVFVSLGYATIENLRFGMVNGWETFLIKLISSVPCHLFIGILMGYYYTIWQAHRTAELLEEVYIERGIITEMCSFALVQRLVLSFIIPFTVSGSFIFAGTIDSKTVTTLFYFLVFMLYGFSFIGIDQIASRDNSSIRFSVKLLRQRHPEVKPEAWENAARVLEDKLDREETDR